MNELPNEILKEIFDQLDPRGREGPASNARRNPWALPVPQRPDHIDSRHHYARLRLVSQRFAKLAAPCLFRNIGLRFNLKSFTNLEKLAEKPELAKYVRKFVYLMPYMYEEGAQDFEAFRNDETLGLSHKLRHHLFEEKAPFYYPTVLKEQQELMRDSYDLQTLTKAMFAFTQLEEVQLLAIMVHKDIVLRNLASSYDTWDFVDCKWIPACKHAVETLLIAMQKSKSRATALCSPTMSPQSLTLLSPRHRTLITKAWVNLTYLEVTFDERPDRSYLDTSGTILTGHNDIVASMFHDFLRSANNLTTLYVRFTPGMPVRIPLKDAFHEFTWSKLHTLGIGSWMVHTEDLIEIIRRHRSTLKGIRFNEVYLFDGNRWDSTVSAIKSNCGDLDWISLHDVSYEREYARKQAYIETYSDTSSDAPDDDNDTDYDLISNSNTSTNATADGEEDVVVYGNVFMAGTEAGSSASAASSVAGISFSGDGGLGMDLDETMESLLLDDDEILDLGDDGRTVSQAQRRHWERWILGKTSTGAPYTRPL